MTDQAAMQGGSGTALPVPGVSPGEESGQPFGVTGATGGPFRIRVPNQDAAHAVVTSIVTLPPGGFIPAHRHRAGAEMHFVLSGDLVDAGETVGPGAFLTHAAGVVHGPHASRGGARVLTVQGWQSEDGDFDFERVEAAAPSAESAGEVPIASAGVPAPDDAAQGARNKASQALGKGYG